MPRKFFQKNGTTAKKASPTVSLRRGQTGTALVHAEEILREEQVAGAGDGEELRQPPHHAEQRRFRQFEPSG